MSTVAVIESVDAQLIEVTTGAAGFVVGPNDGTVIVSGDSDAAISYIEVVLQASGNSTVVNEVSTVVVLQKSAPDIVEAVITGPQGAKGDPGDVASMDLFFQVGNRFYEIAENETAKSTARDNLGLTTIDGGTFN